MLAEVIEALKETEKLRGQIIKMAERYEESEKAKECFFKALIEKEHECEKLLEECNRLRSLCRMKDRIIAAKPQLNSLSRAKLSKLS